MLALAGVEGPREKAEVPEDVELEGDGGFCTAGAAGNVLNQKSVQNAWKQIKMTDSGIGRDWYWRWRWRWVNVESLWPTL